LHDPVSSKITIADDLVEKCPYSPLAARGGGTRSPPLTSDDSIT
jgi:hypothetical protein